MPTRGGFECDFRWPSSFLRTAGSRWPWSAGGLTPIRPPVTREPRPYVADHTPITDLRPITSWCHSDGLAVAISPAPRQRRKGRGRPVLDDERRKQHEEIEDRKAKHMPRGASPLLAQDLNRNQQKSGAHDPDDLTIGDPGNTQEQWLEVEWHAQRPPAHDV